MSALYMEANLHHSEHITWTIHKDKKKAIIAAKFAVEKCGLKESKVYEIQGEEPLGWCLRTTIEPTPRHMEDWKLIAEFKEEVEQ